MATGVRRILNNAAEVARAASLSLLITPAVPMTTPTERTTR